MGRHSKAYAQLTELVNVTGLVTRCYDTGQSTGNAYGLRKGPVAAVRASEK